MARLTRITGLSTVDQLIVGILILFLFVFAFELYLVVPCGGWENVKACGSPAAEGAWAGYYEIDMYWGLMPDWYGNIMYAQDFIYNPFWALSLFMFLTRRQNTPWFRRPSRSPESRQPTSPTRHVIGLDEGQIGGHRNQRKNV